MRIRTQFIVTMFLFGAMLLAIAASAIIINRQAVSTLVQGQLAAQIAQGASELSYLTNDYLIYRESQQRQRWLAKYNAVVEQVGALRVSEPEQQALARSLSTSAGRIKEVFESVATTVESSPSDTPIYGTQLQIAWSRMAVQSQGLMTDSTRLAALLQDQADRLVNIRTWLTYIMIAVFGAYFLINYLTTQRRILRSIARLRAGAAVVGSGNLDYAIPLEREDEIGELTLAFNEMAANLKRRTEDRDRAEEALRASRAQLQAYARELVEASENERRTIARELHDEAGQALASLKMGLGVLQKEPECPPAFQARLDELKQVADHLVDELRKLASGLRPGVLDRAGLVPAVQQHIMQYQEKTGLDVQFVATGFEGERLPAEIETNLYRITQEAMTNIVRYAEARHIGVVIEKHDASVILIVEDDGTGFDPVEAGRKGHFGLLGMRERAEMLNGRLDIETAPGRGTTVYVTIPCP